MHRNPVFRCFRAVIAPTNRRGAVVIQQACPKATGITSELIFLTPRPPINSLGGFLTPKTGQEMIKHICITSTLIATLIAPYAYAEHKHGPQNQCWRDTKYNKHWAYYYCGAQGAKCDGKKSKGHDTVFWQYHGDSFTFTTSPTETYFCCDGTKTAEGQYVRADRWIVDTKTEKVPVEGGTCNKLIQTDACGGQHIIECNEADNCSSDRIYRNGECVKPCGENEVFASLDSNTCIACEQTPYQGIAELTGTKKSRIFRKHKKTIKYQACVKCDKDTEFFDRHTKECVKKETLQMLSMEKMKLCWRCSPEFYKECIKTITDMNATTNTEMETALKGMKGFSEQTDKMITNCHLID